MINKLFTNILDNNCEKDTNPDQETITVNKAGLINDISQLLAVGILTGIVIGGVIMNLIMRF